MSAHRILPVAFAVLLCCACGRFAPKPPPPPPEPEPARSFLAERAYDDVRRLVAIGPRDSGTEGAARAREYLRGELDKLGVEVAEVVLELPKAEGEAEEAGEEESTPDVAAPDGESAEPTGQADGEPAEEGEADPAPIGDDAPADGPVVHLLAGIGGTHFRDAVLLAAAYDTEPTSDFVNVAANGSASGPALVLELARAIAANPLPYDTWIVFLDGDLGGGQADKRRGSRMWVESLSAAGELQRIRLGFVFRQVCDPDLSFERDLYSHRAYREAVWRAARRMEASDVFAPGAGFATPAASHRSLLEGGMRRVVAIVDDAHGGTESPGALAGTAADDLDHCSAESLGITGTVVLEALDELTTMLLKVDRLAQPEGEEVPAAMEGEDHTDDEAPGPSADVERDLPEDVVPEDVAPPAEAPPSAGAGAVPGENGE